MGAELPLPILVTVIATGIPLLLLLVHLGGGSRRCDLDEPSIRDLLAADDPAAELDVLHIDRDGHLALLRTTDGRRFVAWSMESHLALRQLGPDAITLHGEDLVVRLADPGWPARPLRLPADARRLWTQHAA